MYNDDTELLFPSRVIESLSGLRGEEWETLLKEVSDSAEDSAEHLGFILMMTKIDGCNSCNSDSFRAMRGCTQCAILNIRRYRGSDHDLMKLYIKAKNDIRKALPLDIKIIGD
jgi:hypothetical protein